MKKVNSNQLTAEQQRELDALSAMTDDQIDTEEMPESVEWRNAKRSLFYRPVKQQITLRLDADVIAWFKAHTQEINGQGYQTKINRALREYVAQQIAKG
jgi:uncharacterized protein (DUF4415 family)